MLQKIPNEAMQAKKYEVCMNIKTIHSVLKSPYKNLWGPFNLEEKFIKKIYLRHVNSCCRAGVITIIRIYCRS